MGDSGLEVEQTTAPCPPTDAVEASGTVFRCAKYLPPHPDEMRTHEETGRLPGADPCLRKALSVFRTRQDAEHQMQLFRRWKRKFVVHGVLAAEHGKTKSTPGKQPTHTSWWPAEGLAAAQRAALFGGGVEVGG